MSSQEAQGRVLWLWNRLQCMSPAEVLHRAGFALQNKLLRPLGYGRLHAEDPDRMSFGPAWAQLPDRQSIDCQTYLDEADAIARGSVRLFSRRRFEVGATPQWNRCPLTGVLGPSGESSRISITNQAVVGDIKYVWELNRHLHWVALAQAWALSKERRYLDALESNLRSWLQQCPFGYGPNWTSSLEYALRLLNWSLVWSLIGGEKSPLFQGPQGQLLLREWLASINLHVRAIAAHYSRYSSANNHLVGELAGVYVASQVWPIWPSVRALGVSAKLELEREVLLQSSPDGVCREQAFEYASFIFDFFFAAARVATAVGSPMSPAYQARLLLMSEFIAAVSTVTGKVPQVGDADGAEAFRLDPRPGRDCFAAMLHKGACLFERADCLPRPDARRDDVRWLGLSEPQTPDVSTRMLDSRPMDFESGGYFLFGDRLGEANEVLGMVDAGPLGYLGIAAHGHADALQVWLALGGEPVLIDPGTYSYWADKEWRDYFRGTSAHNTVRIGGVDQSLSGGRFMWTRKAQIASRSVQRGPGGRFHLVAEHDGYLRLAGRFHHQRRVTFDPLAQSLLVDDVVRGRSPDLVELFWHLAPGWSAVLRGNQVQLSKPGQALILRVEADVPGQLDLLQAQTNPPLAWCSSAYNEKEPCQTLRWSASVARAEIRTSMTWQ